MKNPFAGSWRITDMELWDVDGAAPRLVAYGTQTMIFSFPK